MTRTGDVPAPRRSSPHDFVLTLIAPPHERSSGRATVETVRDILCTEGKATPGRLDWLAKGEACDIYFKSDAPAEAEAAVRRHLPTLQETPPLDMAVQGVTGRRKRLLAADMDSTLIENEMLLELAETLASDGAALEKLRAQTRRALAGEVPYVESLKHRVMTLKGQPFAFLEEMTKRIRLTPGGRTLVHTMRAHGAFCMLISSGFQPFTGAVGDMLGLHLATGNRLEIRNGSLTGKLIDPIIDGPGKRDVMKKVAAQNKISLAHTMAVGDSANDLHLLKAAGLGVAYRGTAAAAKAAGARISHGDLSALLFLQGYHREEFRA